MATYTSNVTITYNLNNIATTLIGSEWKEVNEAANFLNAFGLDRLSKISWKETVTPGKWKLQIEWVSGRTVVYKCDYPVIPATDRHSINTGTDEFSDDMISTTLLMTLTWMKLIIKHEITNMLWTFTYV